jgi:hypothetical protein
MANPRRLSVAITTASDGSATAYTENVTGRIVSIQYVKNNFADGVDVVATGEATALAIWTGTNVNASVTAYPVAATVVQAGTASTLTEVPIVLVNERVKVVIAAGGNATSGTFYVIVE